MQAIAEIRVHLHVMEIAKFLVLVIVKTPVMTLVRTIVKDDAIWAANRLAKMAVKVPRSVGRAQTVVALVVPCPLYVVEMAVGLHV